MAEAICDPLQSPVTLIIDLLTSQLPSQLLVTWITTKFERSAVFRCGVNCGHGTDGL